MIRCWLCTTERLSALEPSERTREIAITKQFLREIVFDAGLSLELLWSLTTSIRCPFNGSGDPHSWFDADNKGQKAAPPVD